MLQKAGKKIKKRKQKIPLTFKDKFSARKSLSLLFHVMTSYVFQGILSITGTESSVCPLPFKNIKSQMHRIIILFVLLCGYEPLNHILNVIVL
jgi:hypothetical protein